MKRHNGDTDTAEIMSLLQKYEAGLSRYYQTAYLQSRRSAFTTISKECLTLLKLTEPTTTETNGQLQPGLSGVRQTGIAVDKIQS